MKRVRKALAMAAVALVMGSLAAGCGQGGAVRNAISSLSPSRSASVSLPTGSPSAAPETQAPPTSEAPETAAATEPAQAASTAPAGGSGSSLLWLWIVLGAVIVIGVIAWIVRASGRRSAAAAGWRSRMIDTYAKGQALADGLRIADAPGAPAAADAGARWADLQARADDLTQELYTLRESAPDEEDRDRAANALASLRALRAAMADEQAAGRAGGAGSPEAAQVRSRLLAFEASIRALRAADEQLPRI
jgi:hypothetical protein